MHNSSNKIGQNINLKKNSSMKEVQRNKLVPRKQYIMKELILET